MISLHVISFTSCHFIITMSHHKSHHVKTCHTMSLSLCHTISHTMSLSPCHTISHTMSRHVMPCHLCYVVHLTLLMCNLSWLVQELPVLYKPVFLEHLLTSEELQLQKQLIHPLKWNDTLSQVIFCAIRCLVNAR